MTSKSDFSAKRGFAISKIATYIAANCKTNLSIHMSSNYGISPDESTLETLREMLPGFVITKEFMGYVCFEKRGNR